MSRAQAIAPLKVDDLQAFLSQLSPMEQVCLSDNDIGHQELTQMTGLSPGGSPQTTSTIIYCLRDETILRLFLTSLVGLSEPFSPETSMCVEEGLVPLDLRRLLAPADAGDAPVNSLALGIVALNVSVVCMNDNEWDIYAPRLGMEPGFRESAACLFEELGGPEKLAEVVRASSLGEPEELVRAVEACEEENSPSTTTPGSGDQGGSTWKFTTGGWVLMAPVVVDGVVYVGSDDGSLYALAAESGEMLWSFATGDAIRSVPTVVGGTVYFGSNDNHLYAVDADTGEELWRHDTGDWVQYSPALGNGMVYFPARAEWDRAVHAVDADTGEVVWVAEPPYPIEERLTPTFHGGRVYAQGADYGTFHALDAATGKIAWQAEVGGYVESAPAVLDRVVYLTVINQAYAFDEATGDLIWSVNTEEFPARDFPALVVDGIYYLAPSDYVYGLEAATGEELWSYEAYELSAAPVVAGGVLYAASLAEYLFALDALTGEELWTTPTEDFPFYALSVVDGVLYGQIYEGFLVAVDAEDGSILPWDFESAAFEEDHYYTVSDGVVYLACPYNSVCAHIAPAPTVKMQETGPASTAKPTPAPSPSLGDVETAIRALPWVEDGLTVDEQEAVIQLLYIASERPLIAWELSHKSWMQNDLSASENYAIVLLASIVHIDEISANQVVGMPFLDAIERNDIEILETLRSLDQEGIRYVVSHPTLAEASADTLPAVTALLRLEWERPEDAATLKAIPWVNDGVGTSEVEAVLQLQELALVSPKVFRVLAQKPWVRDRLGSNEITVVTSLRGISSLSSTKRDESAALRIADMPFLETIDGVDAAAASSLNQLFWESDAENYLTQVLAHPALEDGISDDDAFVVAALGIVVEDRPDLLDTLLDLGPAAVEKRTIQLPLAGEVSISVLNVDPGTYSTIDILEQVLRAQEGFMGEPLPRSYVGLLVADATPHGGGGGPSGLITVDPIYAEDQYIIAHELAHIYWAFSPKWIAEGGADFMTTVSVGKQFSSDVCIGDTLFDLDSAIEQSPPTIDLSNCEYVLGWGLFLDLYSTLGVEAFRTGFGRLYLSMRDSQLYDECTGLERGLCHVRAAFVADAATESAALAGPVIDRWYYGSQQ